MPAQLVGFAVIGIAVMGLLATGYSGKSRSETAQMTTPVGGATTGMAQPVGTANQPKQYQPADPAPDTRAAPTSSSTGVGPDNGSTGQNQNWAWNIIRLNTGSAASPYYRTWDVDPGSPTYYINQTPAPIPITAYTSLTPDLPLSYERADVFEWQFNTALYLVARVGHTVRRSISTSFPTYSITAAPTAAVFNPG